MFELKYPLEINDIKRIRAHALLILAEFCIYANQHGLPIVITCMIDDKPEVPGDQDATGRRTKTHLEGRAIDVSANGWDDLHQERVAFHLNSRYGRLYGTAPVGSNATKVVVCHDAGSGTHFHLQCRNGIVTEYD